LLRQWIASSQALLAMTKRFGGTDNDYDFSD
jgi:hypothetical protein